MNLAKILSRRLLIVIFIVMIFFLTIINASLYVGINLLFEKLSFIKVASCMEKTKHFLELLLNIENIYQLFLPVSAIAVIFFTVFIWLILKFSLSGLLNKEYKNKEIKNKPIEKISKIDDNKEKEESDKRLFLHLLSALQRDGRLIDFFSEDLSLYEDDQIGAAVRSIHENCKKILDKYIILKPVFDIQEGEEITVADGFDPLSIKLIGNVTGNPPFKGILRHKGWQIKKINLPTISSSQDPNIISSAEVEIL